MAWKPKVARYKPTGSLVGEITQFCSTWGLGALFKFSKLLFEHAPNLQCRVLPQAPQVCSPRDRDLEITEKRTVERSLWKNWNTHICPQICVAPFDVPHFPTRCWALATNRCHSSPLTSTVKRAFKFRLQHFPWETISKSSKPRDFKRFLKGTPFALFSTTWFQNNYFILFPRS